VKAGFLDKGLPSELALALRALRCRAYMDLALRWALAGLSFWAASAALVAAWAKLSPTPDAGEIALLLGVLALGGAAVGWATQRPSVVEVARVADARLSLKERLASALAFAGDPEEMPRRLVADATERVREHRPAQAYPLRSHSRRALALGVSGVLLGTLVFTPNPQAGVLGRRLADQAVIMQAKKTVRAAKKQLGHYGAAAAQAEQALEQALAELQRARTPLQALTALSALEQQLAPEGQDMSQLEAAAAAAGEALQGTVGAGKLARDLSTGNLTAAAKELRQLAKDITKLAPAEQRELAQALEQAAKDAGAKAANNASQAGQAGQSGPAQGSTTGSAGSFANELAAAAQALAAGRKSNATKLLGSAANGARAAATAASLSQELAAIEAAVRNAQAQAAAQAQADASGSGAARRGPLGPGQGSGKNGPVARYATGPGRGKSSGQSALTGGGRGLGGRAGSGNGSGKSKGGTGAGSGNGSAANSAGGRQPSGQVFVGGQPGSNQQVIGRDLASGYKVKTTNYKAVLPSFERTALQGLGSQVVDPADQNLVKNYFSSLGK
jgi:hypothetical protein